MANNNYFSKLKLSGVTYLFKDAEARAAITKLTPTTVTTTLAAASWNNGTYSLESMYPATTYDIIVELNGSSCTTTQKEAWDAAAIQGSPTQNVLKAFGIVPTIDIPIVVRHTQK